MTATDKTPPAPPHNWRNIFASPALWSRIAAGFAALCIIKLILLVSVRKELFELHWRVGDVSPGVLNSIAFYLFAALVGLNVWKLATRCLPAGVRVVRAANLAILFLGVLFILLTFHVGDQNYLNALMTDMLQWKDFQWYLINGTCFAMPFLGIWLVAYALLYYGFRRKGREHLMLRVTAIFATLYIVVCLRDLREFRDALLVADCIGIACLVLNGGSLNPFWMALPLVTVSSYFILFQPYQPGLVLNHMNFEFSVLAWGYLLLLIGITLIARQRGFIVGWWRILPFAAAAFLLINTNYPGSPNYNNVLCIGLMLPRYFLGEFGLMAILFLVAGAYRKLRPTGNLLWLDLINLLLITLALADMRLTQIMGVRLDWNAYSLAAGETTKMMWRMAQPYLPSLALALLVIAIIYSLALWAIRRLNKTEAQYNSETSPSRGGRSFAYAFIACLLLGFAGLWLVPGDKAEGQTIFLFAETSPVFKRATMPLMDRAAFVTATKELGLADMCAPPPPGPAHPPRDLNVIVIFQESTYNKYLSLFGSQEDTQPLLSQYKDRMEIFPNFFSDFAGSINARFATFTGLYPVEDYHAFTTEHIPVKSIFETLHDHGYECSVFYSSFFDYTDFRGFLRDRGIDGLYDADTMPGMHKTNSVSWGLQEEETLGAMRDKIKQYATDKRKFFLTYVPAAPHNPFDGTPRRFQKRKLQKVGDLTPLYLNELQYMDWIKSSLLDQLKESGLLDKTLVVITADHGEMLGEDGGPVGHGWEITPALANVPLIIMDPDHHGYRLNRTIGSQVDLMPTILDSLGIPVPSGELYQGASLYSANLNTNRTMYLNSFHAYGEVEGDRFIRGERDNNKQDNVTARRVFEITNEGAHTTFVPEQSSATNAPTISSFDKFQKNFLHHYSDYCRMFRVADSPK